MKQLFKTTYTNDRYSEVKVPGEDGSVLFTLDPGESVEVEAITSAAMYARWLEIKWREDGKVSLIARPGFQEPDRGRWTLRMLNQDGDELEFRTIGGEVKKVPDDDPLKGITTGGIIHRPTKEVVVGGQRIYLPRHIPVIVGLTLTDPLVGFQSLTIKRAEIRMKSPHWAGYLTREKVLQDVTEPRSDSELKVLGRLLDELGKGK